MKKKKNGFIATSLIYSFFLIFLMVLLSIVVTYAHNRIMITELKRTMVSELNDYLQNGVNLIEGGKENLSNYLIRSGEMEEFSQASTIQTGMNAMNEYRYTGENPNNYVKFNDELWRVIGVFNTDNGTGTYEMRIKLIRATAIENAYWNTSKINTWQNSSLFTNLNNNYLNRVGNYSSTGIQTTSRDLIDNAIFYTTKVSIYGAETVADFYNKERSENSKVLSKVGLMYPSDFGFAVSSFDGCLNIALSKWQSECFDKDWIHKGNYVNVDTTASSSYSTSTWTMTAISDNDACVYWLNNGVLSFYSWVNDSMRAVRPVVYLKSNVLKIDGTGEKNNPYIISLS